MKSSFARFGERLERARKQAGLSRSDVVNRMNGLISVQDMGRYECGDGMPNLLELLAWVNVLKVSYVYLMSPMQTILDEVE